MGALDLPKKGFEPFSGGDEIMEYDQSDEIVAVLNRIAESLNNRHSGKTIGDGLADIADAIHRLANVMEKQF